MTETIRQGRAGTAAPAVATKRTREKAQRPRWGAWLFLLIAAGLLATTSGALLTVFEYQYADLLYPGVRVAGIPLEGLTLTTATDAIKAGLTPYPGAPVVLQFESRRWSFSPNDLGVTVDADATAAQAFALGRSGASRAPQPQGDVRSYLEYQWVALWDDLSVQYDAWRNGVSIPVTLSYNDSKINYQLKMIAQEIDVTPQEGSLTVSGLDVIAVNGKGGRQIDVEATRAALLAASRKGKGGTVNLVVVDRQPVVTSVDQAAAQAKALLSQPLTLVAQGAKESQRFAVDRATLRQWLDIAPVTRADGSVELKVQVKTDLVKAYLTNIAGQINRPVHDASLDFNPATQQIKVVTPSQVGQELDVEGGAAAIGEALTGEQREIQLPVTIVQPKVDSAKISEMGIKELVSEGTTGFAGSNANRIKNIINAASKFNNVVIPPGEEFSFNRYVGDITRANGFVDALVISGDRTEVGVGGGVCQVSTTAFQAAARGGFPIVERWAHSYVVGYYGKPGLDATIFTPSVDMRFKNDTDHYLLVKTEVNTAKSQVTFRYYGTKPGRTVEISEPEITNVQASPKALYKEDPTLEPGVIKQVDWAVKGEDVVVVRTVRNADGTTSTDQFVSKYAPWRSIFLYGPGTDLPAGALD